MLQNAIVNSDAKRTVARLLIDDTDIGLIVRYIGSQPSATVEVSAAGDILFKHGAAGAEAADTTIQIGSTAGTIDVSNAAGNTFGEVVDHINRSGNWKAFIVDALRADNSDASTGSLLAMNATTISPNNDLKLYKDTSKVLNISARIGVRETTSQTSKYGAGEILSIISKNTFGSGTSLIQIYEVDEVRKTEEKKYEVAGAATTVVDTKTFISNGQGSFSTGKIGTHLLVRMIGSAACTGYLQTEAKVSLGF